MLLSCLKANQKMVSIIDNDGWIIDIHTPANNIFLEKALLQSNAMLPDRDNANPKIKVTANKLLKAGIIASSKNPILPTSEL